MATSDTGTRKKGGVSAERQQRDKNFERNREGKIEFRAAIKAAKLLRGSLQFQLDGTSDTKLITRIGREMRAIIVQDPINDRGFRNVTDGPIHQMRQFEINPRSPLESTLRIKVVASINRITGEFSVSFPAIVPKVVIDYPQEATHFKLIAAALDVDFKGYEADGDFKDSDLFPLDNKEIPALQLVANAPPNSNRILFALAGIRFYQKIANGSVYPLFNTQYNALKVIDVNKP